MPYVTFAMALAFCAIHLFIGKLRFLERTPRSRWLSFAGGVAVGYVFLHILPELAAHGETFERETGFMEAFAEGWVYVLSLAGLVLFYGLERALTNSKEGEAGGRAEEEIFWVHIAGSAALMLVIAYLLNHREDPTVPGLALYFAAMTLHFVTADFGSRDDHPDVYDRRGRWVLASATMTGWLLGLLVELPEIAVGCLFAFIGGGIILLVLKEELPEDRKSVFMPFLAGSAIYAALVLGEQYAMTG